MCVRGLGDQNFFFYMCVCWGLWFESWRVYFMWGWMVFCVFWVRVSGIGVYFGHSILDGGSGVCVMILGCWCCVGCVVFC